MGMATTLQPEHIPFPTCDPARDFSVPRAAILSAVRPAPRDRGGGFVGSLGSSTRPCFGHRLPRLLLVS